MATSKKRKHYCFKCGDFVPEENLVPLVDSDFDEFPMLDECVRRAKDDSEFPRGKCPKCGSPCWPGDPPTGKKWQKWSEQECPTFTQRFAYALLDSIGVRNRLMEAMEPKYGYGTTQPEGVILVNEQGPPTLQYDTVRPRYSELEADWYILNTGQMRKNPVSGDPNDVWSVCPTVRRCYERGEFPELFGALPRLIKEKEEIDKQSTAKEVEIKKAQEAVYQAVYSTYGPEFVDRWETPPELMQEILERKRQGKRREAGVDV